MVPLAPRKQVLSMRRHRSNQPNTTPPQPQPKMNHASSSRSVTAGKAVHVPIQPLTRKHQNKNKSKNTTAKDNNNSVMSSAGWRRYGIERRRQLIDQDIREGGNKFDLNYQCRIQGYFALSEKIITQFNDAFSKERDVEGTYVMGNRLCHFLIEALPRHPSYMQKDPLINSLREKSLQSLVHVQKRIEALALRIDEEQLNKYIMHDFDPFADDDDEDDDDDDSSTSSSSYSDLEQVSSGRSHRTGTNDNPQWETFDGWSFDLPDKLTQQSQDGPKPQKSLESALSRDATLSSDKQCLDSSAETEDTSNETFSSSDHSFQASDDYEPLYHGFGLEFLKRIASEKVRYETDSDADDSWAQECESEVESTFYSTTSLGQTYDPARIALQELMFNKRLRRHISSRHHSIVEAPTDEFDQDSKENRSLNFSLSPDNSYDSQEEEEVWTAFDQGTNLLLPNKSPAYSDRVSL